MKLLYLDSFTLSHKLHTKVAHSSRFSLIPLALHWLGKTLVNWLTSGDEIRICKVTSRANVANFVVYDPVTRSYVACNSEEDVRTFLEGRYYR